MMIYKAAKKVRIKLATAKVILSNYRKLGKIFHKKAEDVEQPQSVEEEASPEAESEVEEIQEMPRV